MPPPLSYVSPNSTLAASNNSTLPTATGGTKFSRNYSKTLKKHVCGHFWSFLIILIFSAHKSQKRCLFSTLSPPKPDTFGGGTFFWLEHHTQKWSSRNNSNLTNLLSLEGDRFETWPFFFLSVSFWLPLYVHCSYVRLSAWVQQQCLYAITPLPPFSFLLFFPLASFRRWKKRRGKEDGGEGKKEGSTILGRTEFIPNIFKFLNTLVKKASDQI